MVAADPRFSGHTRPGHKARAGPAGLTQVQACGGSAPGRPAGPGQEHETTMASAQRESLVTEGARSLEGRWILPGQLEAAVIGWFGRFPSGAESREDTYLLDPQLRGLSVRSAGAGHWK
jgi:hypothetical protein